MALPLAIKTFERGLGSQGFADVSSAAPGLHVRSRLVAKRYGLHEQPYCGRSDILPPVTRYGHRLDPTHSVVEGAAGRSASERWPRIPSDILNIPWRQVVIATVTLMRNVSSSAVMCDRYRCVLWPVLLPALLRIVCHPRL